MSSQDSAKIFLIGTDTGEISSLRQIFASPSMNSSAACFRSVPEALRFLSQYQPQMILFDLPSEPNLRETGFFLLMDQVRDIPVVIMTDSAREETALECLSRGAQDYLVKGRYDAGCLLRVMRYARDRERLKREVITLNRELDTVQSRLEKMTMLDPLTDLLNRHGLREAFSRELEILRRDHTGLILLTVDLDNFEQINQAMGRAAGDVILREIAGRIRTTLRMSDYVARVGSDEFIILLPGTRLAEGVRVAEKVRLAIAQASVSVHSGKGVYVTASLGIGVAHAATLSLDQLLSKTRKLLYRSKSEGKNRVAYDPGVLTHQGGNGHGNGNGNGHLDEVHTALQRQDQFRALKQPIVDLSDGRNVGYEFLSRSLVSGFEMPDDFFRASMEANLLTLVDHHCFRACVEASYPLEKETACHINIFPSTLMDFPAHHFLEALKERENQLKYCIEISEQQIIGEPSYLARTVKTFKDQGVQIAIDDVGFGRSCLESLVLLEPDIVKIDKKWVMGIKEDETRRRSLQRILKVSSVLGCEVVAEGIETPDELEVLKDLGVLYGQGYLFGHPA
ncbi:MAG TPA: GGDEF domain-containing response regulator [Verrucomicrobiae bacterium]|jgi:diguanylate cyclase (GGDEF)-like protein|nr:GGDEF domain-containing response regulator [Verrucomicrobiae bacterium]